jgi:hypothetical protein
MSVHRRRANGLDAFEQRIAAIAPDDISQHSAQNRPSAFWLIVGRFIDARLSTGFASCALISMESVTRRV